MKIFITSPKKPGFDRYFPPKLIERLRESGEVIFNEKDCQLTRDELKCKISDCDIIMTHWGSTQYDAELLDCAPKLKLLAHCAGTVARIASDELYKRNIPVISANPTMSRYVAEWVLGAIISMLRGFLYFDSIMRDGKWQKTGSGDRSLFDIKVGLIGLGMVGRELLKLLEPFGCPVAVFDPYLPEDALSAFPNAHPASFEEAMGCDVVSLHASQTPETYHMIDRKALSLMPDGGILINSARGSLIDTEALISELESGRISAALDVFEQEGCVQDAKLLKCAENTLLQPHVAGYPVGCRMTEAVIDDIERFVRGENLQLAVSYEQYIRMTQE